MIYIIKTINNWGQEQGTYTATTSKNQATKAILKYMRRFKLEFRTAGFNSKSIPSMLKSNDIATLNNCLQFMREKNKNSNECWLLRVDIWDGKEVDEAWL